ncbi:MAG: IS1182 family transposase, partial [Actinomycetota bacterium]|nr:IS1182 family transposase [Actinomycetota bacterium]
MMGTKIRSFAPLPRDLSLEELVPEDHFYRRLEARLDLSFVRELVGPLYANGGRPSVDPVVFFKLQLVMFFEDIRSERQLMGVVSDRLSLRWYLGYDLFEPLPDHSSLTRIRERYGLLVFRRFFERIVEECIEAGLVWGEEIFFDATKVEANASMESRVPRFAAEAHLGGLFGDEEAAESEAGDETSGPSAESDLDALPADRGLRAKNAKRKDWISREGKPDRTIVRNGYRRRSDYEVSPTDPDASLMQHKGGATRMGYHAHYVVDGGKARVILSALVTPADVTENQPMLDLLWRTAFRWRARVRRVTGDSTYGTKEIVAAVEKASIRAYVSMADFEGRSPYYGSSRFVYEPDRDLYRCPRGEPLRLYTHSYTERLSRYRADAESCNACPLKPECTPGKNGRVLMRSFDEELLERVRAYRGTGPYEKALRKRKVWVEPMFAEAKEWHGMRRFRLRRLWRVNVEAMVIAAGQNVKRLLAFWGGGPRRSAQAVALRPPVPASLANSRLLPGSHRWRSTPFLTRFFNRLDDSPKSASRISYGSHVLGREEADRSFP